MKFGYYVSRTATRLCKLLQNPASEGRIGFVLIDCKTNDLLRDLCNERSIPFYEISYKELGLVGKDQNEYISNLFLQLLDQYKTPYAFIHGSRILQGQLLVKYKWRIINFHPAVLPAYKGKCAIDQALQEGALLIGNTAHFIDEELDAGKMIMQNLFPAFKFTNYDEVLDNAIPMTLQIMTWIEQGRLHVTETKAIVDDARYEIGTYIPAMEIKL